MANKNNTLDNLPSGTATAYAVVAPEAGDLTSYVVDEILACALLVWVWLHIHDEKNNGGWKDFMGMAVALGLWIAMSMAKEGRMVNPAIKVGLDMNGQKMRGYGVLDWAVLALPIAAAFITSLVYKHFR